MTKSDTSNNNMQMIHIASELVGLIGITFYFTSKHNAVMTEIKKLQDIVQKQQSMLAKYDKKITDLTTVIEKLEAKIKTAPRPMPGGSMATMPESQQVKTQNNPLDIMDIMNTSDKHNIHILESDDKKQSDDGDTESQLDAQLLDELAELGHGSEKSPENQIDLNDNRTNNNSVLSINDAA